MSADGMTCTFSDGTLVTFSTSVSSQLGADAGLHLSFVVTTGGQMCASYVDASLESQLTTQSGEVRLSVGAKDFLMVGPDGKAYAIDLAAALECPNTQMPGITVGLGSAGCASGTPDCVPNYDVRFGFTPGAGSSGEIFHCAASN